MNSFSTLILFLDPFFITPFRMVSSPALGYLLGTALLAFLCFILGDISAKGVKFLNRKHLGKIQEDMDRHHHLSEKALMMGDKESYKAVNRQALDAFGHSFSLGGAVFCVSIWPLPFALAWMDSRFAHAPLELPFSLPFLGSNIHYFASFILIYIAVRITVSALTRRLPWYAGLSEGLAGTKETPA
ncbi:MAG: hypothetical protein M0T82_04840 [Desulfobacteraceae bacterium]|nr:hypothetical protein [Desulfobacteraceae bacterium]